MTSRLLKKLFWCFKNAQSNHILFIQWTRGLTMVYLAANNFWHENWLLCKCEVLILFNFIHLFCFFFSSLPLMNVSAWSKQFFYLLFMSVCKCISKMQFWACCFLSGYADVFIRNFTNIHTIITWLTYWWKLILRKWRKLPLKNYRSFYYLTLTVIVVFSL